MDQFVTRYAHKVVWITSPGIATVPCDQDAGKVKDSTAGNLVSAADASLRRLDTSEAEVPQSLIRKIYVSLFFFLGKI